MQWYVGVAAVKDVLCEEQARYVRLAAAAAFLVAVVNHLAEISEIHASMRTHI